ncbi:MAG: hypothetical protein ACYC28_09525 [Longimicrobiales bacterium]
MSYVLKVSDSLHVPYRGHLLRLKLSEGVPRVKDLAEGTRLRVSGPDGRSGIVEILGFPTTGGRQTQERVERTRELDLVIPAQQSVIDGARIEIGWTVGPADDEQKNEN